MSQDAFSGPRTVRVSPVRSAGRNTLLEMAAAALAAQDAGPAAEPPGPVTGRLPKASRRKPRKPKK